MDGLEMIGGGGYLELAGFEEFLVAAVEQAADLAAQQESGICGQFGGLAVSRPLQDGPDPIFLDQNLICDPGELTNIKLMSAEIAENLVECWMFDFDGHWH